MSYSLAEKHDKVANGYYIIIIDYCKTCMITLKCESEMWIVSYQEKMQIDIQVPES